MNSHNANEALATISTALLDKANEATTIRDAAFSPRSRYGAERLIGQRLQRIGAALIALDAVARGFDS